MAASTIVKHLFDGQLTIKDGTGTPVTFVVPFTNGDMVINDVREPGKQRETVRYEARGETTSVRLGKRLYPTGTFTAQVADYSDGTDETLLDFLRRTGSFSANVSTTGANAEVYEVDLIWDIEGTDLGDAADHQIECEDCDCIITIQEGEPNTLAISFTVDGDVNAT